MIIAKSFIESPKARDVEFTTNSDDRPLVVQFAANNAKEFADAAELIAPCCRSQLWLSTEVGYAGRIWSSFNPATRAD
jgi:hypothetical protein